MNTLFNMNELIQTEQSRQFSDNSCINEVSKITRQIYAALQVMIAQGASCAKPSATF